MPRVLLAAVLLARSVADDAEGLFLGWLEASTVPGTYSTPEERRRVTTHPGDLTNTRIFHEGPHGAGGARQGRPWPHTKANPAFETAGARAALLETVAWLLRRGMSRLQDAVLPLLHEVSPSQLEKLLMLAQRALSSFENFWRIVSWTASYGARQVGWHVDQEMREYGPETNFWLKFRPLLSCHELLRLGPELGGAKAWCNPQASNETLSILSLGAGDDMMYETIAAELFPQVKIFTADCFQYEEEVSIVSDYYSSGGTRHLLPFCLTGEDPGYIELAPEVLQERFLTYPILLQRLQKQHGIEGFDFIKSNIEASEYPLFAHIMRNVDANLKGTQQIHLEMHRMGMHAYEDVPGAGGRDFNSLLFMQLLWATFLSGGFHPVFVEKWHDRNAAADVVFVNQTWWLLSELEAMRSIWTRPWPSDLPARAAPDATRLAEQHAAGEDPYQDPTAARTRRGQPNTPLAATPPARARESSAVGTGDLRDSPRELEEAVRELGGNALRDIGAEELEALQGWGEPMEGRDAPEPFLVKIDPYGCEQCAVLDPVWKMIAAGFHTKLGYSVPVCRIDCERHSEACIRVMDERALELPQPYFCVWMGQQFECYNGPKQPDALLEWLLEAVRRATMLGAFRAAGVKPDAPEGDYYAEEGDAAGLGGEANRHAEEGMASMFGSPETKKAKPRAGAASQRRGSEL